jgi:hypothetical protein
VSEKNLREEIGSNASRGRRSQRDIKPARFAALQHDVMVCNTM